MLFAQWEEVASWLEEANAVNSPAELQGHLAGRAVAGEPLADRRALAVLSDCLAVEPVSLEENERFWREFAESVAEQIDDAQYQFALLLPDDSSQLPFRLLALGQWCQGFLAGVGSVIGDLDQQLDEGARELLSDLAEIAQISVDEQESDENEYLYAELVEYVRVAMFNLAATLRQPPPVSDRKQ